MSNNFSRDSYSYADNLTIISTRAIIFTLHIYFLYLFYATPIFPVSFFIFLLQGEVEHSSDRFLRYANISCFFLIFFLQGEVEHSSDLRKIHQCPRTAISHKRICGTKYLSIMWSLFTPPYHSVKCNRSSRRIVSVCMTDRSND